MSQRSRDLERAVEITTDGDLPDPIGPDRTRERTPDEGGIERTGLDRAADRPAHAQGAERPGGEGAGDRASDAKGPERPGHPERAREVPPDRHGLNVTRPDRAEGAHRTADVQEP